VDENAVRERHPAEADLLLAHALYVVVRKAIARKPEPQKQVEKPSKAAAVKKAKK
jgi:hypothetical protein